jgi:hypothetical protein
MHARSRPRARQVPTSPPAPCQHEIAARTPSFARRASMADRPSSLDGRSPDHHPMLAASFFHVSLGLPNFDHDHCGGSRTVAFDFLRHGDDKGARLTETTRVTCQCLFCGRQPMPPRQAHLPFPIMHHSPSQCGRRPSPRTLSSRLSPPLVTCAAARGPFTPLALCPSGEPPGQGAARDRRGTAGELRPPRCRCRSRRARTTCLPAAGARPGRLGTGPCIPLVVRARSGRH